MIHVHIILTKKAVHKLNVSNAVAPALNINRMLFLLK